MASPSRWQRSSVNDDGDTRARTVRITDDPGIGENRRGAAICTLPSNRFQSTSASDAAHRHWQARPGGLIVARRKMRYGKCSLCGLEGDLTFEHVPPKKAFNDRRTISLPFDQAIRLGPDAPVKGRVQQGGVGGHTLCQSCNSDTGRWYAPSLIDWCYRGMEILERSRGRAEIFHIRSCHPLRVIKEIVVMFCSVNAEMTTAQPWIRRFLLNTHARDWDPEWRVFVYYNLEGKLRYAGGAGMINFKTGGMTVMSEINYPPFGYVLVMNGADAPDPRLTEITHFARYGYDEIAELMMPMSVLPTHLVYPGDYRTRDEIRRDHLTSTAPAGSSG
jgi:hypothetical protein